MKFILCIDTITNGNDNISENAVYSQLYEEGRYFRRHELTVSTWYTALLLTILAAILAVKTSPPESILYNFLYDNILIKIFLVAIIIAIGGSAILSIRYSKIRYDDIRTHLDKLEPSDKNFKKTKISYTPRQLISVTLFVLTFFPVIIILI